MIILHFQRLAILTPPKCATNTLHSLFCRPPWGGVCVVGPSPIAEGTIDRHVRQWPQEVLRYRKLVAIRHPLERLVSMYLHNSTRLGGRGQAGRSFAQYAAAIVSGEINGALYGWNLSQWLDGVEYDNLLRVESLRDDLALEDIQVEHLPTENKSYRAQPYRAFYDDALLQLVAPWARPDCDRFGYEWPSIALAGISQPGAISG